MCGLVLMLIFVFRLDVFAWACSPSLVIAGLSSFQFHVIIWNTEDGTLFYKTVLS